ncbi:MAG: tyrosine-protein kinase family protein, partial [Thermodesulfobacteriota bacterium]
REVFVSCVAHRFFRNGACQGCKRVRAQDPVAQGEGGEGVSSIIVNLADYVGKTESGKNILVIDGNFHRPVLHEAFDVSLGIGLIEILKGTAKWSDAVNVIPSWNIHFLSCGGGYQQMAGALDQEKKRGLVNEIKSMYDLVLVDSAPLLVSSDSLTIALASDASFLVLQSNRTPKEVGERAKALLHDNECLLAGALLNQVKQVVPGWMYKLL